MTALAPAGLDPDMLVVPITGAAAVPAERWDSLARRGFHRHGWMAGAERCGWTPRHVGVTDADGLTAMFPAWLVGDDTAHDLHDRWLGPLSGIAAGTALALRPILSVQSPFAQTSEPMAAPAALPDAVLHRVFASLEAAAAAGGARAVAWPFVDISRTDLIAVARARGYAVTYSGATARLRVPWTSLDDYIASRSKSVRRTVRADLRALDDAGLRTAALGNFRHDAAAMDALYRDAFRRRNGCAAPGPSGLFDHLASSAYPACVAQLTWDGRRLVGMSLNIWTRHLLDGTFAAFTAAHGGGPAYYNDLCYEPLRLACREGISGIDLGASALYAKVLRGAVLHRRVALVRGTSPLAHRALTALGTLVAARVAAKERRALGALWGPRCFEEDAGT